MRIKKNETSQPKPFPVSLDSKQARRFNVSFERSENCWNWTRRLDVGGYGRFYLLQKYVPAHRVSYQIVHGKIPSKLLVLHKCENRKCVNPSHLFLGTQLDNVTDCIIKRRFKSGARNALKKDCPKGHPYLGKNLFFTSNGGRACRTCHNNANRRWRKITSSIAALLLLTLTASSCGHGTITIQEATMCSPAGAVSAGGNCSHLISPTTQQLTFNEYIDFLEPQAARACVPVQGYNVCADDQTTGVALNLPARGGAIAMSSSDFNNLLTELESACRELGGSCPKPAQKVIASIKKRVTSQIALASKSHR